MAKELMAVEFHNGFSKQKTNFFPANNDVYFFIFLYTSFNIITILGKYFIGHFLSLMDLKYIFLLYLTPCYSH